MSDKSIRTTLDAFEIVKRYASEEGITQAQASAKLVEEGLRAIKAPAFDSGQLLATIMALVYVDKNGNAYSVPEYAEQHGITPFDAACKLVRIALGREGALARDRAKRPAKPRAAKPTPEAVPMPWELPEVGAGK